MADPDEVARLFVTWDRIVGPEVAAKCKPTSLKSGVLKVRTESSAWAWEMKYLSAEVVSRINKTLGKQVVTEIKPWVKPVVGENGTERRRAGKGKPRMRPPASGSVSGKEAQRAAELAGEVPDERVAEALRKALLAARKSQGRLG